MSCDHEECEPYNSCRRATEYDRRRDFWMRLRSGRPTGHLGTDPLAWENGDVPSR